MKSIIENAKLYKKLEEHGNATSNAFYKMETNAYKVGLAVAMGYIYHIIDSHNFDAEQVKRYIISTIKDDADLKDCFYEVLKNI